MKFASLTRSVGLLALLAPIFNALASTNGFYVPTIRDEPSTRSSYWENFTVPVGAPGNHPDFGNDLIPLLTQSEPGAIITGGAAGNIYNMPAASQFTISYSGTDPIGLVVFQARTAGTEIAYDSVMLNYSGGSLGATRTELDRSSLGAQGFFVSSAWQWNLAGLDANSYTLTFHAAETSLSFDAATLDTQVVPEPATWALMTLGGLALAGVIRRANQRR